jgi:hypothetical protein
MTNTYLGGEAKIALKHELREAYLATTTSIQWG